MSAFLPKPVRQITAMWAGMIVWLFCPEIKTIQGRLFPRVWYRWTYIHIS